MCSCVQMTLHCLKLLSLTSSGQFFQMCTAGWSQIMWDEEGFTEWQQDSIKKCNGFCQTVRSSFSIEIFLNLPNIQLQSLCE